MWAACLLGAVIAGCSSPGTELAAGGPPRIVHTVSPARSESVVEVVDLRRETTERLAAGGDLELRAALRVFTREAANDPAGLPMLGDVRLMANRLVFTPRFPFAPGTEYVARFEPGGGDSVVEHTFAVAAANGPGTTRVVQVYPSTDTWPMNNLKMYVEFSAPMRRGQAFEHIRLIDESTGAAVEQPFVTVREELWDASHRTLTVLYDPARIKRGLVPNEEAGLPLLAGKTYRLIIDSGLRDAAGLPLAADHERRFDVGPEDRSSPHPDEWHIEAPAAATMEPLTLSFAEPMDRALLETLLSVAFEGSEMLAGSVEVAAGETEWRFHPDRAWAPGDYEIVVPTILEDLAGNNLKNLFDVDLGEARSEFADHDVVTLPFRVR